MHSCDDYGDGDDSNNHMHICKLQLCINWAECCLCVCLSASLLKRRFEFTIDVFLRQLTYRLGLIKRCWRL